MFNDFGFSVAEPHEFQKGTVYFDTDRQEFYLVYKQNSTWYAYFEHKVTGGKLLCIGDKRSPASKTFIKIGIL